MTHTYSKTLYHLVWSTKNREPYIQPDLKSNLYTYIRGIVEGKKSRLIIINGMPDHVHLLVSIPLSITVSALVQQIKVSSTRWVRKQYPKLIDFSWQEGLGAFTVGYSNFEEVVGYITNQEKHHRRMTFEEEYIGFLKKLKIAFDERFVLG